MAIFETSSERTPRERPMPDHRGTVKSEPNIHMVMKRVAGNVDAVYTE